MVPSSLVYAVMLMNRHHEMTVIWTCFMINDSNQSRLQTVLCENSNRGYYSILLEYK